MINLNEVILKNIKNAFTGTTPVKAIYSGTNKIWEKEEGTYTLIEDSYIEDAAGFYHQKLVKYGELIPGVQYETPAGTSTSYEFVNDTEITEKLNGYAYLMSNNKGVDNSWAQIKLFWEDIEDFTIYYRSYAESNYDYVIIQKLDGNGWTSLPSPSSYDLANTKGNQTTTYKELNMSGEGSHHLYICYRKDSSASSNSDRGYIYFKAQRQDILDTKAGELLPYEYLWYGDSIIVEEKYHKKLVYTATLPNGVKIKNENLTQIGEELLPIEESSLLTIESLSDSNEISYSSDVSGVSFKYAIVGKSFIWNVFNSGDVITLNNGEKLMIKGNNNSLSTEYKKTKFNINKESNIYGILTSLVYGDDCVTKKYINKDSTYGILDGDWCFSNLFEGCKIVNAENLDLTYDYRTSCYNGTFKNCEKLIKTPKIHYSTAVMSKSFFETFIGCKNLEYINIIDGKFPIVYGDIASEAYAYMFSGCTSLKSAGSITINATFTGLSSRCCDHMFSGCTSLTTAPSLPVKKMTNYCYNSMFQGCTSLTTAPSLPATTLANDCYNSMFQGCTSLTTAPSLPATTLASSCYSNMFKGCTSLTTSPELPATILKDSCYDSMFYNTNVIPDTTNIDFSYPETYESSCYKGLFAGTKITDNQLRNILPINEETGNYYLPRLDFTDKAGGYGYMFCGCTSLTTAPELPATTLNSACYKNMFYGCTSLTTAPELPATTLYPHCYGYMFYGCTSLTTAPELPATTLETCCYDSMFQGCTSLTTAPMIANFNGDIRNTIGSGMFWGCVSLNYVKFLTTSITKNILLYYFGNWLYNVSSTGTFVVNPEATWPSSIESSDRSASTIPAGWTIVTSE